MIGKKKDKGMVTVRFLHLLRSKYRVEQLQVEAGSLKRIIDQILTLIQGSDIKDFDQAVIFVNQIRVMHIRHDQEIIRDGDTVVITHFVGGG